MPARKQQNKNRKNKVAQIEKIIHKGRRRNNKRKPRGFGRYGFSNGIPNAPPMGPVKVKGKGAYSFSDMFNAIKRPFEDNTESKGIINRGARGLGNLIGNETGLSGAGSALGNAASWLSRAFGFGAYTVRSNSLMSQNIAQFESNGSIEFAHREFVSDVSSSTGFTMSNYIINPGNATLFPWLSTIAQNFEQYEMLGLIFEFKSTSATAVGSVNTGLGTVIMATDYDVLDTNYGTKRQMEISDFATSSAPCETQIHPVECDPKQNVLRQLFIQPGNSVSSYPDDARFSAMGNFQLATSGMQAVSTIGELWVSYHVRLHKPQLLNLPMASAQFHCGVSVTTGGVSTLAYTESNMTSSFSAAISGTNTVVITPLNSNAVGTYLIVERHTTSNETTQWLGDQGPTFVTAGDITVPTTTAYTEAGGWKSASVASGLAPTVDTTGHFYNNYITSGKRAMRIIVVTLNAVGSYVEFPVLYNATSATYVDFYLIPYHSGMSSSNLKPTPSNKEISNIQQQLDFLVAQNKQIMERYNSSLLKNDDWSDDGEASCLDEQILVLRRDNHDLFSLKECEGKISLVTDMMTCSLSSTQSTFLSQYLKKCVTKLKSLH